MPFHTSLYKEGLGVAVTTFCKWVPKAWNTSGSWEKSVLTLSLLVSEWFQCYKQLLDVSMKALLSALIPLRWRRNLSSASGVIAVGWHGSRKVGHCCSNSSSSVCILKESSFAQFWKKRCNHLSPGGWSRLWIPQGEGHLWITVKERVSGLSIPSWLLQTFGFLRYWEPKKSSALFFCLALASSGFGCCFEVLMICSLAFPTWGLSYFPHLPSFF